MVKVYNFLNVSVLPASHFSKGYFLQKNKKKTSGGKLSSNKIRKDTEEKNEKPEIKSLFNGFKLQR